MYLFSYLILKTRYDGTEFEASRVFHVLVSAAKSVLPGRPGRRRFPVRWFFRWMSFTSFPFGCVVVDKEDPFIRKWCLCTWIPVCHFSVIVYIRIWQCNFEYFPHYVWLIHHLCLFLPFQQIDGEAFLLMTQTDIVKIMSIKLGPALKIFNSILMFKAAEKNSHNELWRKWIWNTISFSL